MLNYETMELPADIRNGEHKFARIYGRETRNGVVYLIGVQIYGDKFDEDACPRIWDSKGRWISSTGKPDTAPIMCLPFAEEVAAEKRAALEAELAEIEATGKNANFPARHLKADEARKKSIVEELAQLDAINSF